MIQGADVLLRCAKLQCPRDQISLAEEALRLLQVTRATPSITSSFLEAQRLIWKTYRRFSKDIIELTNRVKRIHVAVEASSFIAVQPRGLNDV
ncbi:hypothetical protein FB451DRAFT_1389396 [Mycena latifolia]|nr:hypothetical protein FB451DRAFT_1389396 [Mycena latifolia]